MMAELKDLPMLSLKTQGLHLRLWLLMVSFVMVESLDLSFHPLQAAVAIEVALADLEEVTEVASVDLEEVTEAASVDWGFMPLDIETYLLQ
jgi:hypothetical protein